MKISNIYVKDYDQFSNVNLDFTDPKTGQPVDKVCFIGRNGTGKSKILQIILWLQNTILANLAAHRSDHFNHPNPDHPRNRIRIHLAGTPNTKIIYKIISEHVPYFIFYANGSVEILRISEV